ncbi:MAG: mannose-1-phosphate guanylyltransferase/mannose-6-phosphate isomerase [Methylophaga sp.]|nr:mannose-1-phosphate guanylyltransferase/mannose-6-phosphate isomerase [Methylophaga sp.]
MIPVILSGGTGSRLWPLSRKNKPKQFLNLFGEHSLFQETVLRLAGLDELQPPMVICNENHRFMVGDQLGELGLSATEIILEPYARNTAPAVTLAALRALQGADDPILLILAADHVIKDVPVFHAAIEDALKLARQNHLVTFGIQPDQPHTGYGYIESAEKGQAAKVVRFIEKPDLATAESYLKAGNFYWNSGMFMFKASVFIEEMQKFAPEIVQVCRAALNNIRTDLDFTRLDAEAFQHCPSDSVDYAVMEKTQQAMVVPLDAGWSDVGSWSSLWENHPHDQDGNVTIGDVLTESSRNCYIHSENRLVTAIGVEDLIIVETHDAVMVVPKSRSQDVKTLVERLNEESRSEADVHRTCYRPWGHYDSIDAGGRFQVKRITVKPGASLSLQMHYHRAEHWVVVSGTAEVTCNDEVTILSENQSTYIPVGAVHRLSNPGRLPLELIEVQSGSYLEEDDIIRIQDNYNRQ